ncbi:hypothetical protein H4S03_005217, partial [Coemansia sp. S3946]
FLRLHYALNRILAIAASSTKYMKITLIRQEAASLGGDIIVAILAFASLVHSGINCHGTGIEDDANTVLIALALNAFAASAGAVNEMRMGIMAQNCATPGFATLAFMLSTSVADHVDWDFSGVMAEAIAKSAGK